MLKTYQWVAPGMEKPNRFRARSKADVTRMIAHFLNVPNAPRGTKVWEMKKRGATVKH